MQKGPKEDEEDSEDFYEKKNREALVDDDELTLGEDGFMQGYEDAL